MFTNGDSVGACAGAPTPPAGACIGAGIELDAGAESGAWEAIGADSGAARASPPAGAPARPSSVTCIKSLPELYAQVQSKLSSIIAAAEGLRMSASLQTFHQISSFQNRATYVFSGNWKDSLCGSNVAGIPHVCSRRFDIVQDAPQHMYMSVQRYDSTAVGKINVQTQNAR